MAAKRKVCRRNPVLPKAERTERKWSIEELLKDDPLFQDIIEELLHPKDVTKEEELVSSIGDFLNSLCNSSNEPEDAGEFRKRWEQFLNLNIALVSKQMARSGIPNDKIKRLIVYGWACFEKKSGDIHFRFGPPLDDRESVLVILVFRDAVWHPPAHIEAAVWQHPIIRNAAGKVNYMGWKDRVERRLAWAASLSDEGDSSQRLRELSDAISNMLYVPNRPNLIEESWISSALDSQRFWAILAHAVDFGIHQNARRLFMDGKLLGAAQQSALNDKIEKLSWFLLIEEAIREKFEETGRIPTPSELRKLFGLDAAPGSDAVILEFPDRRFRRHGEITWGPFKKYAKQAGKIWSDRRTQ